MYTCCGMLCCLVVESYVTLLWPCRLQPTRLLCPWDSPSKNNGGGCYFLLQGIFQTQGSKLSLLFPGGFFAIEPPGKPMECRVLGLSVVSDSLWPRGLCSLPGSSVRGIFQAGLPERVAISYSRGSSQPKDRIRVSRISCIGRQILYHCTTMKY